jgi:hypothetical protein
MNDSSWTNQHALAQAHRAAEARKVSGRRRLVDPTTCERDYSVAELQFMQAIQGYKQKSGRMFPTWSEVLEVLSGLGYTQPDAVIKVAMDAMPPPAQDELVTHRHARKVPSIRRDPPGVPRASHTGR